MQTRPLDGLRVLEFTQAVMGPSCGLILAEMGAEVVSVEAPTGSPTRELRGFGSGYFPCFGRSKKSIQLDLKDDVDRQLSLQLLEQADILIENFAPGTMDRLGLAYETVRGRNPRLIYCSMKGFLSGPYEHRTALDEVVQMMGGLAYMTGPSGQPLRVGSSVIDITGGMFAVIAILAALRERDRSGRGQFLKTSLFETTAFLMGQHLAWSTESGLPLPPMPERVSAWAIYQIFATLDQPVFIGVISDKHWLAFCREFQQADWAQQAAYRTNNLRIENREILLPLIKQMLAQLPQKDVLERCERAEIPFAKVARPEELFDDPQLLQGGLEAMRFPSGKVGLLPRLPMEWNGERFSIRHPPPELGEHQQEILKTWLGGREKG